MNRLLVAIFFLIFFYATETFSQTPTCSNTANIPNYSSSNCTAAANILNVISTNANATETLYKMAQQLGTPDTLLDSAHAISQGESRPDLYEIYQECVLNPTFISFCPAVVSLYTNLSNDSLALHKATTVPAITSLPGTIRYLLGQPLGGLDTIALTALIEAYNDMNTDFAKLLNYRPPVQSRGRNVSSFQKPAISSSTKRKAPN
jgi:hypothetical protein